MNSFDNIQADSVNFDEREAYYAAQEQLSPSNVHPLINRQLCDYDGDCEPLWNEW